jgi:hypothetical protein
LRIRLTDSFQAIDPFTKVAAALPKFWESDTGCSQNAIGALLIFRDGGQDPIGWRREPVDVFRGFKLAVQALS